MITKINEFKKHIINEMSVNIKWKPSVNDSIEGFISKTFPHNIGLGDAVEDQDKVKDKWSKRLSSILGTTTIDLNNVVLFTNGLFDFKFEDANDNKYRIYKSGEGSKSATYVIQKYK